MTGDGYQLHLAVNNTAINRVRPLALTMKCEPVRLDDRDELRERHAGQAIGN